MNNKQSGNSKKFLQETPFPESIADNEANNSGHATKYMTVKTTTTATPDYIRNTTVPSVLPEDLNVQRGETQRNVNAEILKNLVGRFPKHAALKALDLPCGSQLFLSYLKKIFPAAEVMGADIVVPEPKAGLEFVQMDLTKEFKLPREEQFDLITSISGVMMFNNTLTFIENCTSRLKKGGTFVVTNDNSLSIMDRVRFLLLGRVRMFSPIYEDREAVTQNVPVMELIQLLRTHGIQIDKITYTSFYMRDLIWLPLALLVYPLQSLYLMRFKTRSSLPKGIVNQAYAFRHLLCRHYIIIGKK